MAVSAKRSEFLETSMSDTDMPGGSALKLFALTAEDDISAVALTNNAYQKKFAKQLLNEMILAFREYHSSCPSVYMDMKEDSADWDTALEWDDMRELFNRWCDPANADITHAMEEKLM